MNISIIGTGAYGMALACMFHENKNNIIMWSKFSSETDTLRRTNRFKDYDIPSDIKYTNSIDECIKNSDLIVIAIPLAFITDTMKELKEYYNGQCILVASKGIEQNTNNFAVNIIKKIIKVKNIGVISGGTFASDMIKKEPMGITLATKSQLLRKIVLKTLKNDHLKVQTTTDVIGIELCGSIKNIMAIGSGILDGYNYGDSTKYLFITKATYEIQTLIKYFGGNYKTILTYAGIDDIYMTCSSQTSRNYTFGTLIGKNESDEVIEEYKKNTTIEGLYTTKSIYDLLKSKKVNCILIKIIYGILYKGDSPDKLVEYLEKD